MLFFCLFFVFLVIAVTISLFTIFTLQFHFYWLFQNNWVSNRSVCSRVSRKNGNSKNFKEIPKKILTYYLYYYILLWNFFWELSKISEQVIIITRLEGSFFPFSGYYPPFTCGAIPAGIYLFKTNNRNTRTYFTPCSRVSFVNFEYVITGWDRYNLHISGQVFSFSRVLLQIQFLQK